MGLFQNRVILFFATGAGVGHFPRLPGTMGTLLAIPFSLAINRLAISSLPLSLLTLVAFVVIATWLCKKGEEILAEKDPPRIVIDEIAGFLLANFLSHPEPKSIATAFLLFRFFDIIKVFPASRLEQIQGGVGIMLDDLIAGLYTFLILRLLIHWSIL